MTQKHTQGPWRWTPSGSNMSGNYSQPYAIGESDKANLIAGCFGDVKGGEDTAKANAALIAAAPDLLAFAELVAAGNLTKQGFVDAADRVLTRNNLSKATVQS